MHRLEILQQVVIERNDPPSANMVKPAQHSMSVVPKISELVVNEYSKEDYLIPLIFHL